MANSLQADLTVLLRTDGFIGKHPNNHNKHTAVLSLSLPGFLLLPIAMDLGYCSLPLASLFQLMET